VSAPAGAHLELLDVSKRFGGVRALEEVSLSVVRGSVHALVGENGAGKSTLGSIVAGALGADSGQLLLNGLPVAFRSPREALERGVARIAQEPSIVPQLSVAENVHLGSEPRRLGFVARRALAGRYRDLAESAGFDLPGRMPAQGLRTAEQQKVEILRALSREAEIIVMDEPSAALTGPETQQLHEIIRGLAARGTTIVLISHFLGEVLTLADSVTVLRDGKLVRTAATADETESSLIEAMLGRSLTATFPPRQPPEPEAPIVLSVRNLSADGVDDVSFDLRAGEIVGIAGLVGAGRTELARAIFGADRVDGGTAFVAPDARVGKNPGHSLRNGLAMLPESRKDHGLLFGRSVVENVTIARLRDVSRLGVIRPVEERRRATALLRSCDVRAGSYAAPVRTLSGGNQQKVLFARMLLCKPRVIIADEPTRGVDIGAKRAIYDLLVELTQEGMGILVISSELEEILGLAHRVLVMRRGRVAAELVGDEISEPTILAAAFADPTAAGVAS
jgi:rhamnose transport system ATP-binding protein